MTSVFVTQNLRLAAALVATGRPIHRIYRDDNGLPSVEIASDDSIATAVGDYYQRRIPADARTLLDKYQAIRAEVRETMNGGGQ